MVDSVTRYLEKKIYANKKPTVDIFRELVLENVKSDSFVLNAGCGFEPFGLKGKCKEVIGVDLDPRIAQNSDLDGAVLGSIDSVALPPDYFDVVVCQWVVEHLENPLVAFKNINRMMKTGGKLFILTSNTRHYVNRVAKITPHRFNQWYCQKLCDVEAYPVYYRCNTDDDIISVEVRSGFELVDFEMIEPEPNYLKFSLPTFLVGVAIEKVLSSSPFEHYRRDMIVVLRKI